MLSFLLVSEERLHFASQRFVFATRLFEEFSPTVVVELQCTGYPTSSPAPQSPPKLSVLRPFLLCSIRQIISVPLPCFSSHLRGPMPSTHHPAPRGSCRGRCPPTAPRPKTCEALPRLFSGSRGS